MRSDIIATFVNPPIPSRKFDWSAVREGYEPGDRIGYGETKDEAVNNLRNMENE